MKSWSKAETLIARLVKFKIKRESMSVMDGSRLLALMTRRTLDSCKGKLEDVKQYRNKQS